MAEVRCKETTMDFFFSNFLYQQKVAKDHFLEKLDEIIIMVIEKEVKFGKLHVVDNVHTIADVNLVKDERRKRESKAQSSSY